MRKYNKNIGALGEMYAAKYLESCGYSILTRNYSCCFGELDIIGLDGECLAFIEVKTRTTDRYGAPQNAVNYWKRKHMEMSARYYIEKYRMGKYFSRFDIVEVFAKYADNNFRVEKINVIKNAFLIGR